MADDFKFGEQILILLTAEHELPSEGKESAQHGGKFIRFHGSKDWADVELDEPHAGGTVKLAVPVSAIVKSEKGSE